MSVYAFVRDLHIAFGTLALVAFWATAVMRKGTSIHKLTGRIYGSAILAVLVTALPLALHAFEVGRPALGIFLLYLMLITGTSAWSAWRAVRHRTSLASFVGGAYRPLAMINVAAGIAILAVGVRSQSPLLSGMSAVGIVVGYQMLRFSFRPSPERQWWLKRHYVGIVGSGIATHIAFLNLGLSHLVPASFAATITYVSWFGPLAIGLWSIQRLNRRHAGGKLLPRSKQEVRSSSESDSQPRHRLVGPRTPVL